MDLAFSGFIGIIEKVRDDLIDNDIIKDDFGKLILFSLHSFFYGASSYNDFNFALIVLYNTGFINAISNKKPLDNYENSILISLAASLPFTFSSAKWLTITELGYLIYMNLACYIEPFFINEEHSSRKLIIRLVGFVVVSLLTFFGIYYNLIGLSMQKYFVLVTCYLITSVCFQLYKFIEKLQVSKTNNNDYNN